MRTVTCMVITVRGLCVTWGAIVLLGFIVGGEGASPLVGSIYTETEGRKGTPFNQLHTCLSTTQVLSIMPPKSKEVLNRGGGRDSDAQEQCAGADYYGPQLHAWNVESESSSVTQQRYASISTSGV
jgi:hypothetical protein